MQSRKDVYQMAKITQKQRDELLKTDFLDRVADFLSSEDGGEEEVLRVKSNEIAIPVVDSEGNERWMVLTFKVPTGERGGDGYDGYSMAEDYQMKQEAKAEKKAEKEAKAEADRKKREAEKARKEAEKQAKAES
jgi:ATPase subunit of ABC transporter with duplicated ATPase domains